MRPLEQVVAILPADIEPGGGIARGTDQRERRAKRDIDIEPSGGVIHRLKLA
jgi:hypothetical protein